MASEPLAGDPEEFFDWIGKQPPDVAIIVGTRAALRVLPTLRSLFEGAGESTDSASIIISLVFRAVSIPWAKARLATQEEQLGHAARLAADAIASAVTGAIRAPARSVLAAIRAAEAAASTGHSEKEPSVAAQAAVEAAAEAAGETNAPNFWRAIFSDVTAIERGEGPEDLAFRPLWPEAEAIPEESIAPWRALADALSSQRRDWSVWIAWYEARLRGGSTWPDLNPEQNETLEIAIATLPDDLWERGPATVNAEIKRLITERIQPTRRAGDSAVALLQQELASVSMQPSSALQELFRQAALLAPRRRRSNRKLTTSLPMFAAMDLGSSDRADEDWGFLTEFSRAVRELAGSGYDEVRKDYFLPETTPTSESLVEALSDNIQLAVKSATEFRAPSTPAGILGVDAFLLALLRTSDGNAVRNLAKMAVDVGALRKRLGSTGVLGSLWSSPAETTIDEAEHIATMSAPPRQRHATEYVSDRPETGRDILRRAPLAFALAAQINRIWDAQIKGEPERSRWRRIADALHLSRSSRPLSQADEAAFILHIDAPWGGGKTTFANFIARILNPGAFGLNVASADGASLLKALPLDDDDLWKPSYRKRRWHVVHFNAWQNEHVSPPWWNFYESIRRQCLTGLALASRAAVPKTGEERGTWSTFPLRLAGRGVWLWFALREWLWKLLTPGVWRNLLIFAVLFVIVLVVWNTGWFQTLTAGDTETPRAPQSAGDAGATTRAAALGILTVLLTGGAGITVINLVRSGISFVVEGLGGSADATSLGQADPLFRFQRHFSWFVRQLNEPVLVIVDDLDRCKPEYVVELVRGLPTIFRSSRVVFLLLGDKTWIEDAFAQVHENMAKAHTDAQITFGGRFAEKAIQLSFILPEATDEQRNAYLVAVLTGKLPVAGTGDGTVGAEQSEAETKTEKNRAADLTVELETFEKEVRQDFSTAHGTEDLVRMKTAHRSRIGEIFQETGDGTDDALAKRFQQAAAYTVDVEAVFSLGHV